ncbi:MAG: type II toxin-antitoxin system VapB family antitoxin [Candidatus Binatia bacterium]
MPLNIKNSEVERLVAEIAATTGESKAEAIRKALLERQQRLALRLSEQDRGARLQRLLAAEIWPTIPARELGRRLSRQEEDAILGYGPDGV